MNEYIMLLSSASIFSGLNREEILSMLSCMQARCRSFKKGEYVLQQGQKLEELLILLSGSLHIRQDDYWGNRSILGTVEPGEMFGESYACSDSGPIMNDVAALSDSVVLFLNTQRVLKQCGNSCPFHAAVIENLFKAISGKNRALVQKLGHMSRRSTREKLISYLSSEAKKQGKAEFVIPFKRQQLADYLSVDRSAMSSELGRMKAEGLIEFNREHFILYHKE